METAARVLEVQEDLEPGSLVDTVRSYNADQAVRAGRATEVLSSKPVAKEKERTATGDEPQCGGQPIKPNPSESDQKSGPDRLPAKKAERRMQSAEAAGELSADDADSRRSGEIDPTGSDRIRPNQTKPAKPGEPGKIEGPMFNPGRARLEEFVPKGARSRPEAVAVGREEDV
jgi:hypothetical protein